MRYQQDLQAGLHQRLERLVAADSENAGHEIRLVAAGSTSSRPCAPSSPKPAYWQGCPGTTGPGRLSGRAMSRQAARPILAREVTRAARAARTEEEFFALLDRAGLLVSLRPGPPRTGPAGYAGYAGYAGGSGTAGNTGPARDGLLLAGRRGRCPSPSCVRAGAGRAGHGA
jgi:hypothetical protein